MRTTANKKSFTLPTSLTTVEAAWITETSPKTINATIDRGELKSSTHRRGALTKHSRRLGTAEVLYLALRKEVIGALSPRARRELYLKLLRVQPSTWKEWHVPGIAQTADFELELAGGIVKVELKSACKRVFERWEDLREANEQVVSDPEIRGGEPVIRGTRVPAFLIADLVKQGADRREILEDYPGLSDEQVRAAITYAETHLRRGRPQKAPWRD
jgi:uncharacterized protein (DUF433 family)